MLKSMKIAVYFVEFFTFLSIITQLFYENMFLEIPKYLLI